jgi:uncharacterized membrane protein
VSPEDNQRLEAIERRQAALEQRLVRVESLLKPKTETASHSHTAHDRRPALEAAFGLTWTSRIGVITLVLALAFFFEYAFENHWITEWGRIALGWGCGAASLLFGERLWRGRQHAFAQAITAAGIAFWYLSFWAAFALYQLLTEPAAFGLMLLTTAAGGALALRYDAPAVAGMALISGYATPFLLGTHEHAGIVLLYFLLAAGAGLIIAGRRDWSGNAAIAFLGFWAAYTAWISPGLPTAPVFLALTVAFLLFLGWPLWRARYRAQRLQLSDLVIVAFDAALYLGFGYFLLVKRYRAWEGLFTVAVALLQAGEAKLLWRGDSRGSTLSAGVAWALLVLAAPIQLAGYRVTITWALEGAALTWIATKLRNARAVHAAGALFALVIARLAWLDGRMYPNAVGYLPLGNARFLTFLISAAALWSAAWWARRGRYATCWTYAAGHVVLLWGLALETVGWVDRSVGFQNLRNVATTAISVLIAVYAVILVAGGVFQRHAPTRLLGVALIGLVVLKLYLYDVWLLAQFYRMAAFAILGVLLLIMSYFYSRFRNSLEHWWHP